MSEKVASAAKFLRFRYFCSNYNYKNMWENTYVLLLKRGTVLRQRRFLWFELASFCLLVLTSCEDLGNDRPIPPPPPLPDDVALYVSMDGEGAGLWILNANSLGLVDSMITKPGVPWTVEFSSAQSTWHSCWGRGTNYSLYSGDVHPLAVRNGVQLQYAKGAVVKSADESYLVAYGYKGIDVFERATLNLVYQDTSSSLGQYSRIVASQSHNRVYFTRWENRHLVGFGVYDLDSLRVTDVLTVFDSTIFPSLEDVDLIVSPDDRFLFFSAWNWRGGGGFGSFFVIDLIERRIASEFPSGAFSQLAISPDGRSVYIGDPGGYLYMFRNSRKVLRYDVQSNSMHVLLSSLGGTDRIAVAEDNRTVFISAWLSFQTPDGHSANVVKVDALSGQIIGSYAIPLDTLGRLTSNIRNIRLGK